MFDQIFSLLVTFNYNEKDWGERVGKETPSPFPFLYVCKFGLAEYNNHLGHIFHPLCCWIIEKRFPNQHHY